MNPPPDDLAEIFGPPIHIYTRAQALADGIQVEVTKTAAESSSSQPSARTGQFLVPSQSLAR